MHIARLASFRRPKQCLLIVSREYLHLSAHSTSLHRNSPDHPSHDNDNCILMAVIRRLLEFCRPGKDEYWTTLDEYTANSYFYSQLSLSTRERAVSSTI